MTVLLAVAGDRAAQGFSILQNLGAAGALFSLVRQAAGPWSAMVCTLGFATLPPVVYFTGCGYVEPAFLLAFGSSLLAWAIYKKRSGVLAEGARLRMLGFLGLLAGWIPALKYNGLIYFGLIGLGILWQERKGPTGQSLLRCGMFGLTALPGLSWLAWNWITLGNPVYPLAWFLFGGAGWDEVRALSYSRYFDLFGMGRTFSDYLLLPWRFAFSGKFDSMLFDGAAGPFLLVFTFLAAASMTPWVNRRAPCFFRKELGWMFLVSAAFFVFGTQQARFWLPSHLLACSLAAPAVEIWVRVKSGWIRSGLGLIMIACLVWNGVYLGRQIALVAYYRPVLGFEKEEDFLARKVAGFPAIRFLNRNLSESSRCLCVWTGVYGYYIERPYYSDTFVEDATLKELIQASTDGEDLARRLVDARFTHLYVHLPLLLRNLDPRQLALFSDFVKRGASEVYHYQDFHVFAILKQ